MTEEDLKILRRDYLRNIFPSATVSLFLIFIALIYSSLDNKFGIFFIFLPSLSIVIGFIGFLFITRLHRLDLKLKVVSIENAIIENKEFKVDYEAGSASTPVNLLSFIFMKDISQRKMKEMHFYTINVKGEKLKVNKAVFDKIKIGDKIRIPRIENTKIFLGVEI